MDRREFLRLAGAGAAGLGVFPMLRRASGAAPGQAIRHDNIPAKYALELDGVMAGWLYSVEGGHAISDGVDEKLGPSEVAKRHTGVKKYEDITLQCGTGMSKAFFDWAKDSFDYKATRKSGSLVACDFNGKQVSRLEFTHTLVTEIGLPPLDAASKDAARMTLKLAPETTRYKLAGGAAFPAVNGVASGAAKKKWLPSNFRLSITGCDQACRHAVKIDPIIIRRKPDQNAAGGLRGYEQEHANVSTPNLVVIVPEADAEPFLKWHEEFVIKGNNGQGAERAGRLDYLAGNAEILFTLDLPRIGIFSVSPEKIEAGSQGTRRMKVQMYCETMKFSAKDAASLA